MTDEIKNNWDVGLQIITMCGAAIAFWIGLRQWRRGQDWQRAEQMDKFVIQFEKEDLLCLGSAIIDWTTRHISFHGKDFKFTNEEVLLALRDHTTIKERPMFPGNQASIRDAFDALLSFFARLELSISTKLIDIAPAKQYFRYWLFHLLEMDHHPNKDNLLEGKTSKQIIRDYILKYGDPESIRRLCQHFNVDW